MKGVESDRGIRSPPRPHLIERHLGALCPGVLLCSLVGVLVHLQSGNRQTGGVHPSGRHREHPRIWRCLQLVEQQPGHQERSDDLDRSRQFQTRSRNPPVVEQRSGIVNQDVEPVDTCFDCLRHRANGVEVAHVRELVVDRVVAGDIDELVAQPGHLLLVASNQDEGCAVGRKLPGRRETQSGCGTGDGDDPPGEVVAVDGPPTLDPAARLESDVGERRDDRRLEHTVENCRGDGHETSAPRRAFSMPSAALSPILLKVLVRSASPREKGNLSSRVAS